jgi:hypothetical protein
MSTRRPRVGERRQKNQPLKIDKLPLEVRDAIQHLRNQQNKTWDQIEELSSLPFNKDWQTKSSVGFVNWDAMPTAVLELFPDLKIPQTNLARWYDLRVAQVMRETMARSAQARELATAFAKSVVARDDQAVINAARDQLMSILAEETSSKARINATKGLIALADTMIAAKKNDLRERQVGVQEKTLQMKLDLIKQKAASLIGAIEGQEGKSPVQLTREELLEKVRDIYGAV